MPLFSPRLRVRVRGLSSFACRAPNAATEVRLLCAASRALCA